MNQYYHQKVIYESHYNPLHYLPRSTVAVEVPEKIQLTNLIQPDKDKLLMLYVGFTLCNPLDRFVKSEGRKVADSRLKPLTFTPKSITYDNLYNMTITMVPISPNEERIKELTFKVFSSSNRVYLIGAKVL